MLHTVLPALWAGIFRLFFVNEFIYSTEVPRVIVRKLTIVGPQKRTSHFENIKLHYTALTLSQEVKTETEGTFLARMHSKR